MLCFYDVSKLWSLAFATAWSFQERLCYIEQLSLAV
jgi:hypothetical protein